MDIYRLASTKTLEASKAELEKVSKDIDFEKQILQRHMKAPVGKEVESVDLKPMIEDTIQRLEWKRTTLFVEIDELETREQHKRAAMQSSKPSQSGKTGNGSIMAPMVLNQSPIQYPKYFPPEADASAGSSQHEVPWNLFPPLATPGQHLTARHTQPQSSGPANLPSSAVSTPSMTIGPFSAISSTVNTPLTDPAVCEEENKNGKGALLDQQHHSQELSYQQLDSTFWYSGPDSQGFQPQQTNSAISPSHQPINDTLPPSQENDPGLPVSLQYPSLLYEQPNNFGNHHAPQYGLSHQGSNVSGFPDGSQPSPFQTTQSHYAGFPLQFNLGSHAANTNSALYGYQHAAQIPLPEYDTSFTQYANHTGGTLQYSAQSGSDLAAQTLLEGYDTRFSQYTDHTGGALPYPDQSGSDLAAQTPLLGYDTTLSQYANTGGTLTDPAQSGSDLAAHAPLPEYDTRFSQYTDQTGEELPYPAQPGSDRPPLLGYDTRFSQYTDQTEGRIPYPAQLASLLPYAGEPSLSLTDDANGLVSSAYQTFQGGYNVLNNSYLGSLTSARDAGLHGIRPTSRENLQELAVNDDIKQLLDNILPDGTSTEREDTPESMAVNLYEHQKIGFAWMKSMEKGPNKGGILADDMGLGKTVEGIALMVSHRSTDDLCKTTLIVCTVALIQQWKDEIREKIKPGSKHCLSVFVYHHNSRNKTSWEMLRKHDVVITTYGKLVDEYKEYIKIVGDDEPKRGKRKDEASNENSTASCPTASLTSEEKNLKAASLTSLPLLGPTSQWYRIILDEAQNIKNETTKANCAACLLNANSRICMTGTPMMNGISELFALIKFLGIKPYCDRVKFKEDFLVHLNVRKHGVSPGRAEAMRKLHILLAAIMLRRTKLSILDGRPILTLPKKIIEVRHCVFSDDEKEFYKALEATAQAQFKGVDNDRKNHATDLTLLLRLRQACCHPHLIKHFGIEASINVSTDQLLNAAKALDDAVISLLRESDDFECLVCFDAIDNPVIPPCAHPVCAECFANKSQVPGEESEPAAFQCTVCHAIVKTENITDLKSFNVVHRPELVEQEDGEGDSDSDSESESESDSESEDYEDYDDDSDLGNFIVPDDEMEDETDVAETVNSEDQTNRKRTTKGRTSNSKRVKLDKGPARCRKPKVTIAELKAKSRTNFKAKRQYLRRLRKLYVPSAKIDKTMEILGEIAERNAHVDKASGNLVEKTIVFSQFTSLLDLLEVPVSDQSWGYARYDGAMSPKLRNHALAQFKFDEECTIILVSLKAGNAGLNLTVASQIIMFDPFWNPSTENQAVDRAYRIGQMRDVTVHRLLVPDTVEDRIQILQEQKRELIEGALDENASQGVSKLDPNQLAYLFGIRR